MGDWPEFYVVGGGLLLAGVALGWHQIHRVLPESESKEADLEAERLFFSNQKRRRLQVAVLIAMVGVSMISCAIIDPKDHQVAWWTLVLACLLLAGWIALLAVADALATWFFRSRQLRTLATQRQLAEAELERLQRGSVSPGEMK